MFKRHVPRNQLYLKLFFKEQHYDILSLISALKCYFHLNNMVLASLSPKLLCLL